jgi:hypothetical protein
MDDRKSLFELEQEIHESVKTSNDPHLAEALLGYFREVRHQPYLTLLELKSLFISFNGRVTDRGESHRYPLSQEDIKAFERVRKLTGISTNSLEGIIRTHARATPELIQAQKERAMSRQAADIISRLDKENAWLQGRVVQIYFAEGLEIKDLRSLVANLAKHRQSEQQEAILREFRDTKEVIGEAYQVSQSSIASDLSGILDTLQTMQFEQLDDDELLATLKVSKHALSVLEDTQKKCFGEVKRRFED